LTLRVLVTGASGFVGRALCPALEAAGFDVVRAMRRQDGGANTVSTGALGSSWDWFDRIECPDVIVHLAARVHQMREAPEEAEQLHRAVNTEATLDLARRAAARGVKRLVFLSSVKVNGEGRLTPYGPDDPPAPSDAYGRSKAAAEAGLFELAREGGMEVVVLRPPLIHGPGVQGNMRTLLRVLRWGIPLPLGSVTTNRRSLVGVDNLVSCVQCCLTHPDAAGAVWFVSDGEDVSTAGLLRRMGLALKKPARLWPLPVAWLHWIGATTGRKAAMDRLCGSLTVDILATRERLGWTPPVSLEEGLRRCVRSDA
jgi:nucleoside-diphosphate-sugar epimerase